MISSDPAAGAEAEQGSTVTITVSTGPGTFAVPTSGVSPRNAQALLSRSAWWSRRSRRRLDTVAGRLGDLRRPRGRLAGRAGRTVTLTVSTGPADVAVPTPHRPAVPGARRHRRHGGRRSAVPAARARPTARLREAPAEPLPWWAVARRAVPITVGRITWPGRDD